MAGQFPYEDIINLPPHISQKYPQASIADRAARFSPFAAITGYEDMVQEAARVTRERIILDENVKRELDEKMNMILEHHEDNLIIEITYYLPDDKKSGGDYVCITGSVKRIDSHHRCILMQDGREIPIEDIFSIEIHPQTIL